MKTVQLPSLLMESGPVQAGTTHKPAAGRGSMPLTRNVYSINAGNFVPHTIHDRDTMQADVATSGPCLVEDHASAKNLFPGIREIVHFSPRINAINSCVDGIAAPSPPSARTPSARARFS